MASVYLVRHIETKIITAYVWGYDMNQIWDTLDENFDPFGYEYATVDHGAILFRKEMAFPINLDIENEESPEPEDILEGAIFLGVAGEALLGHQRLMWKPFPCHAELREQNRRRAS